MATSAASSIKIRRSAGAEAAAHLAKVATTWPDLQSETRQAIQQAAIAAGRGEAVVTLAALDREELCDIVIAHILPGRVASLIPPLTRHSNLAPALARDLLLGLDAELRAAGVDLVQTLLTADDVKAAVALRSGNYEHAADLLYLAAEADCFPDAPLALPFQLRSWRAEDESSLAQLLEATYVGTLDCPRIDGLRKSPNVLAGYRAVGESGDSLWQIVRAEEQSVGCLLLADHPATRQWEIVYVGLIPGVRGRGWGLELTRHAQWLARSAGRERLVLAVDAANEPAIRMYSLAGFRAWDRRAVWIKPLNAGANSLPPTT
jgi:ribosomal protein S18 acetylase RimI-like enzyme